MGGQYQAPLLFGLNSTSAAAIYSRLEPIEFRHGVVVYRRGDDGGCLYTITEGAVSLVDGRGAKRTCAADGSGALALFGEESLFDDIWPSRPETASVLTMHASTLQLSAENIEELVGLLRDRYLGLDSSFGKDIAFAINGEIYRDDWTQALPDGAEIFLMPRIEGG